MDRIEEREQFQRHLDAARRGETDALAEVLLAYLPLVRSQAFSLSGGDLYLQEDLSQEGLLALCRAVQLFSPPRGPFGAFAKVCVRNAMISLLRRRPPEEAAEDERLEKASPPQFDLQEIVEGRERLQRAVHLLSDAELMAMDAFLETGGVASAAQVLRWPRKRVDNALSRARSKLREAGLGPI